MLRIQERDSRNTPLWLSAPRLTVGAAEDCDFRLPEGPDRALVIETREGESRASRHPDLSDNETVRLNDKPLTDTQPLGDGDSLVVAGITLDISDPVAASQALQASVERLQARTRRIPAEQPSPDTGWALVGLGGLHDDKRYPLSGSQTLGRDTGADLVIPATHLSREHTRLTVRDGAIHAEDLASVNGTFINDKRIRDGYLKPGDELRCDTIRFRVEGPEDDADKTRVGEAIDVDTLAVATSRDRHWKTGPTSRGNNYRTEITDQIRVQESRRSWLIALGGLGLIAAAGLLAWWLMR